MVNGTAELYKNETQQCLLRVEDPSSWHAHGGTNNSNGNNSNSSSVTTASGEILPLHHPHHHHYAKHTLVYHVLVVLAVSVSLTLLLLLIVVYKRIATRQRLEKCRLPTVYWRPRFVNYQPSSSSSLDDEAKKLSSSNVTNILPRMQRLKGPFGMYGTVYGLSTAVVHIAHPIPAAAVLSLTTATSATTSSSSSSNARSSSSSPRRERSRSLVSSSGATKAPAYNHFKNFCGDGVFTADGTDWREKRAAVLHALLRPSNHNNTSSTNINNNNSAMTSASFETKLQAELAITAQRLIDSIEAHAIHSQQQDHIIKKHDENCIVRLNIVPILQQATIGLIFRYITDSDPVDIFSQCVSNHDISTSSNITSLSVRDDATSASSVTPHVDSLSTSSSVHSIEPNQQQQSPSRSESTTVHSNSSSSTGRSSNSSSSLGPRSILQPYLQSITDIRMIILAQSRSIWFLLPRWCYTTFSAMYRAEEETLLPIRQFAQLACQRAIPGSPLYTLQQLPKYSSTTTTAATSSAASASSSATSTTKTFSKNLLDEATTLLFAGQDTSAATMSWTLHLLSLHPQIQNKVAAEVQGVLGNNHDCSDNNGNHNSNAASEDLGINKKVMAKMPYLDAVVKEAMRLYPVAPFVVRKLPFDVTVDSDSNDDDKNGSSSSSSSSSKRETVTLPAGTFACIWIYSLHRNPEFWQKPNTFWPERWLLSSPAPAQQQHDDDDDRDTHGQPPVLDKGITNGAFMPFAVGPRNCVGQPLAYMILRTLLARLLQRFEFRDARCSDSGGSSSSSNSNNNDSVDGMNGHFTSRTSSAWSVDNPEAYLKDMQAGFTVLPQNGVTLAIFKRET